MVDRNVAFMDEYWEKGLKISALESLDKLNSENKWLVINANRQYLEELQQKAKIVDSVMARGVSTNRDENEHPSFYHRYEQDKEVGLITYTPLTMTTNNQNFIDPKKNKDVFKGYEKMVLRVLVLIRSPLRLSVPGIEIPLELNTNEHLVIFENDMVSMPHLESSYRYETLLEWLGKYQFGEWRVADIDNFMYGNSLFRKHEKPYQIDPVFKGSKLDKGFFADIRKT